ncbi:hypothetical protein CAOG_002341 [Capsaspora owczarzaki ATCC 30864]|uniref:RecQ-mediated genome instability protein 1 n=2 Tax=Capsaspora owczarzaki (strain ATCC 30864) TaxID=595528 RepID=A0A0D2X1P4_CAPO3|nr:hypothetical protein CAOG_002341 [Capsaspora owczarzaki ATCC 30864]
MQQESASVGAKLANQGIHVLSDWLSDCIAFLQQEAGPVDAQTLHGLVMEQWLSANLRDIGRGCLPELFASPDMLREVTSMVITHPLALQIEAITDVGDSAFRQIEGAGLFGASLTLNANDEDGPSHESDQTRANNPMYANSVAAAQGNHTRGMGAARLLVLKLSDGQRAVRAMTYRPIPTLTCDTLIGTKLLISNVTCRRGMLLLEPRNTKMLGGGLLTAEESKRRFFGILFRRIGQDPPPSLAARPAPPASSQASIALSQATRLTQPVPAAAAVASSTNPAALLRSAWPSSSTSAPSNSIRPQSTVATPLEHIDDDQDDSDDHLEITQPGRQTASWPSSHGRSTTATTPSAATAHQYSAAAHGDDDDFDNGFDVDFEDEAVSMSAPRAAPKRPAPVSETAGRSSKSMRIDLV